jgi:predicted Rossmann-fold nucleotide-binding protein/phosphoglycolate phosphatase-like HAD superfamily hydrolase
MTKQIAVFGSFLTGPRSAEYALAEEIGCLLARQGLEVLCGGHGGVAVPLAAGVTRGGGRVRGISLAAARAPRRKAEMGPLITVSAPVATLGERLERFAGADGFIFFTGGIGTLSEFAFIWHSLQLDADFDRPLVLLGRSWKQVLETIRAEQMIKYKYYRMLHLCERAVDTLAVVANDYTLNAAERLLTKRRVLFELDGALIESPEETFIKGCENLGRFFHLHAVVAAFRESGGYSLAGTLDFHAGVLQRLGVEAPAVAEIAAVLCHACKGLPMLYDDVVDTLNCCKRQGVATGVVSSRPLSHLRAIIAAHGLDGWFDLVCPRPTPSVTGAGAELTGVLQDAGWSPEASVYVADRPPLIGIDRDVDVILLDRHLADLGQGSMSAIRSLRELPALLRQQELPEHQHPSPAK